ncbi:PREDICTED: hemagglutinin/amebocyte aggregation factor-like [Acropora digitifera]|uniref:hemagglutinin/amebocyte aggregation factor-like n=1 Tax=Acropora digitifera TaxID=70779 RepID=UPI00077A09EF|nr:PREDICTED: hemagglutinin/amebocyte aggregation factor-like [Acropora digitifera]
MKGSRFVVLLPLVVTLEMLLFTESDGWWSRRRCSSARPSFPRWVNGWQEDFKFSCPTSNSIMVWQSQHRNCKEDRIHYFKCKYGPFAYGHSHCSSSSHYANDYDRPLAFKCARNGVIAGVKSTYSAGHRDRRFSFRCCHKKGYIAHTCKHTVIENKWDKGMKYTVPWGYDLVGAFSEHNNDKEDRIWKFEICKFSKVPKGMRV